MLNIYSQHILMRRVKFGSSPAGMSLTFTGTTLATVYFLDSRFEAKAQAYETKFETKIDKFEKKLDDRLEKFQKSLEDRIGKVIDSKLVMK